MEVQPQPQTVDAVRSNKSRHVRTGCRGVSLGTPLALPITCPFTCDLKKKNACEFVNAGRVICNAGIVVKVAGKTANKMNNFNPFTVPAREISRLKRAHIHSHKTVYLKVR